jgi:integrase
VSRPQQWPVRVKSGNSTISIYRIKRKKIGRIYIEFKLAFYDELGHRKFQSFSSFERAREAADNLNVGLRKGEVKALTLSNQDKLIYLRALKALEPTGAALDLAAHQFAEATKLLGGASLIEAARYYVRRSPVQIPRKTVQEVVTEFIESRRQARRSEGYLQDVKHRLSRFSEAFHTGIADVIRGDVVRFLTGLRCLKKHSSPEGAALSPRSLFNYCKVLRVFFEFAKEQGYLPKDHEELRGIKLGDADPGEIEIYTPAEMAGLLSVAPLEMVPFLAMAAFAGLRSKELERLDWSEVQLSRGFIELKRSKAKTGRRRLVPIAPNLAQWLKAYAQESGHVWTGGTAWLTKLKAQVAADAGIQWKHNALRHSFASYRLAQIQNANQVALETGHSVQVLFTNYRELVTPEEAQAWFGIVPEDLGQVEIYRPEEMSVLLRAAASSELVPALALCGFSGLGTGEVESLSWSEIDLDRGLAELKGSKLKNGQPRQVPLIGECVSGLRQHAHSSGPIWLESNGKLSQALEELAAKTGVRWRGQGLWHSYAAYRLAQVQDATQVANETGLSPHSIFTRFEGLVDRDAAQVWFGTSSTRPSEVPHRL